MGEYVSGYIYKYCSINTAKLILSNNEILLNTPANFNDPYDTSIIFDEDDLRAASDIILNYFGDLAMMKVLGEHYHSFPWYYKLLSIPAKFRFKLNNRMNQKYEEYRPAMNYTRLIRVFNSLGMKNGKEGSSSRKALDDVIEIRESGAIGSALANEIAEKSKELVVSCFSKSSDSILMWGHYANNNRGACIEFDNESFLDVVYSNKRSKMRIKKIMYKILWKNYSGAETNFTNSNESKYMLAIAPFLAKSSDWKYEKEVRCIYPNSSDKIILREDQYFYKMGKIKSITLGCRIPEDERNEMIDLSRIKGIEIFEMVLSKDTYLLEKKLIESYE